MIYTSPGHRGGLEIGDIVVVVSEWPGQPPMGYRVTVPEGTPGPLADVDPDDRELGWCVAGHWVYSIRRPTPEELAAYQLAQGTPEG